MRVDSPVTEHWMHIGIIGHGTWLPPKSLSAADLAKTTGIPEAVIAEKFGLRSKPVAGPTETTAFMGLEAARRALADAAVDAAVLDLVIWCGAQHKDYPCWLAGLYVADKLGAARAWSFDMEAMCGSMMAALDVAKSLMLARDDLDTVLLVSGYRNNDLIDPALPATRFMLDIGSGGSAIVLKKNAGRNAVLASAFRGDGSLSELCVVPTLGSKAWPPRPGDEARARFHVPDEEAFKRRLGEVTMPNFYAVIRESLRKSGVRDASADRPEASIDYLAVLHLKRSAHEAVLAELGLGPGKTTYLEDYGHLGQNDQVLSLELGLAAGKVRDGSRVVFVGAGLGFVWAATTIEWGPARDGETLCE
jgi:3-oxoacyl-[acyl-carrier-protein] synthase-3